LVLDDKPTEPDHEGNINNIYTTPPKPLQAALPPHAGDVKSTVEPPSVKKPDVDGSTKPASNGVVPPATIEPEVAPRRQSLSELAPNLANTVVASEGTSSALGYVASGVGAVINHLLGVDPINAGQVNSILKSIQMWFQIVFL